MRTLVVRADADARMGSGHVVRCLALAQVLTGRGWRVILLSHPLPAPLKAQAEALGVDLRPADGPVEPADWALLDHYECGAEWLEQAATWAQQRLVLDDLGRGGLPCELLVDSGPDASPCKYSGTLPHGRLLLGPRYALLRPAFARHHAQGAKRFMGPVRQVLVALGGGDPQGMGPGLVRAVRSALPEAHVHWVTGAGPMDQSVPGVTRYGFVPDPAPLMLESDLAIGGGGVGALERCCLGLPSLVVVQADNQRRQAEALEQLGAVRVVDGEMEALIGELAHDGVRQQMSRAASQLVDGRGAERLANQLEGVRLRPAGPDDEERIWRWANAPEARAQALNPAPIPRDRHHQWYQARLQDPGTLLWVGETGAGPVGYLRMQRQERGMEVSIALDPAQMGVGLGAQLLEAGINQFVRQFPGVPLVARIREGNAASRRIFARYGFQYVNRQADVLEVVRP